MPAGRAGPGSDPAEGMPHEGRRVAVERAWCPPMVAMTHPGWGVVLGWAEQPRPETYGGTVLAQSQSTVVPKAPHNTKKTFRSCSKNSASVDKSILVLSLALCPFTCASSLREQLCYQKIAAVLWTPQAPKLLVRKISTTQEGTRQ